MQATLQLPGERWKHSYLSLVQEFRANREPLIPFVLDFPTDDFGTFLENLSNCSAGKALPGNFVPHTTYWLVDENDAVVAVSNLRHRLTDSLRVEGGHVGYGVRPSARRCGYGARILAETLKKAKEHGIDRALLTCAKTNSGSAKIIVKNGGVLDSEEFIPTRDAVVQRYWILID